MAVSSAEEPIQGAPEVVEDGAQGQSETESRSASASVSAATRAEGTSKKREWVAQLQQHESEISKCQVESYRAVLQTKAMAWEHCCDLKRLVEENDATRVKWQLSVYDGIRRLRQKIIKLADETERNGGNLATASSRVTKTVQALEAELTTFKERQRQDYDELTLVESTTFATLKAMEERFTIWQEQAGTEPLVRPKSAGGGGTGTGASLGGTGGVGAANGTGKMQTGGSRPSQDSATGGESPKKSTLHLANADKQVSELRDALDALTAEIEHDGGASGGWLKDDHDAFMRMYGKCKSMDSPAFYEQEAHKRLTEDEALDLREEATVRKKNEEEKKRQDAFRKQKIAEWKEQRAAKEAAKRREEEDTLQEQKLKDAKKMEEHLRTRAAIVAFAQEKKELAARAKEAAKSGKGNDQVITREQKEQLRERSLAFEKKRVKLLEECREKERQLSKGSDEMPARPKSAPFSFYQHVGSRLHDQTEAQIQKLKARERELKAAAAKGDEGQKYGVVAGNFADQIGVQARVTSVPQWRQKIYG
eukprot:g17451.t1